MNLQGKGDIGNRSVPMLRRESGKVRAQWWARWAWRGWFCHGAGGRPSAWSVRRSGAVDAVDQGGDQASAPMAWECEIPPKTLESNKKPLEAPRRRILIRLAGRVVQRIFAASSPLAGAWRTASRQIESLSRRLRTRPPFDQRRPGIVNLPGKGPLVNSLPDDRAEGQRKRGTLDFPMAGRRLDLWACG